MESRGNVSKEGNADPGVDADEATKKRQREELMYWNHLHLEKLAAQTKLARTNPENKTRERGSSFDDFLQEDPSAEKGAFIYHTGTDVHGNTDAGLRNRGARAIQGSVYANPFSDEHNIEADTQQAIEESLMSYEPTEKFETMSDIYSASEAPPRPSRETTMTIVEEPQLIDTSDGDQVPDPPISYPVMYDYDAERNPNFTNMTSRDDIATGAFASIHAWADEAHSQAAAAQSHNNSFYSPLPTTPRATTPTPQHASYTFVHPDPSSPVSPLFPDPPISVPGSDSGDVTPTDSVSLAGSGFESAEEIWARSAAASESDVVSLDGEGISTPGSWSEVGSVVSENEIGTGTGSALRG